MNEYLDANAEENDNVEIFETGLSYEGRPSRGVKVYYILYTDIVIHVLSMIIDCLDSEVNSV